MSFWLQSDKVSAHLPYQLYAYEDEERKSYKNNSGWWSDKYCMLAFETTDWSILKSEYLDEHIQNVTVYINIVTRKNATEKQFYIKNN